MKFTIVYQSRMGKTAAYARAMAMYLWQKGMNVSLCATSDFKREMLEGCDCLMLGCWTSGWFVVYQHPNEIWKGFAKEHLQGALPSNMVLFTTYKIRTGRLFRRMLKRINMNGVRLIDTLKSRSGVFSAEDKVRIDSMIEKIKH